METLPESLTCPVCRVTQRTTDMPEGDVYCDSCLGEHGLLLCVSPVCWNSYDTVLDTWAFTS